MCFFAALQDPPSHLHLMNSLLFASVATIPNQAIRYSVLGLIVCLNTLYTIHLKSPSIQFHNLATMIDETDELLRRAMAQRPREYINLTEQMNLLLEANKAASVIKCRLLESDGRWYNWKNYLVLSNTIATCGKRVRIIRIKAELTMEVEHQRKIEDDINEIQFILAASPTQTALYTFSQYRAYRRALHLEIPIAQAY
ncbi:hypothetical protein K438DRAFT_1749217 [Mycena galopus ATCC 62051]|nr:hypothetical protein K438DRAFT_1749217 [Mycena galopus ATCC 62051]